MANYANAKATIAANIYTNHTGQVTAEMVKTAANEIVNTLIAGGYLYAGVAHPGDAAVTPDANVFYIASEPGTYTNKGGLVVADGEVAIFKFNGTWSKEVTGAATVAQVNQLGKDIDGHSQHNYQELRSAGATGVRFGLVATTRVQEAYHIVSNVRVKVFTTQNSSSETTSRYGVDSDDFVVVVPAGTLYFQFAFDALAEDTTIVCNTNVAGIKDYDNYLLQKQIEDKVTIDNHVLSIGGNPTSIKEVSVVGNRLQIGGAPTNIAQQFINVNDLTSTTDPYASRAEARLAVPSSLRRTGLEICYLVEVNSVTHESEWCQELYFGSDTSDNKWENDFNWVPVLVSDIEPNSPNLDMFGIKIGNSKYRLRDGVTDGEIFETTEIAREGRIQNVQIDINGTIVAQNNFQVWYYPVVAGKKYRIKLYVDSSHASAASFFSITPVSGSSGTLLAYKNPAKEEMAAYTDYTPSTNGYVGISVYGTIRNNIGFYELVSIIQNEISERKLLDNEAFRNYTRASISSVSGNFEFTDGAIVASSTNGSKLYYTAVQKGQVLRLAVAAHDSKSLCKYAFSTDIPAENVAISGVTDLSTTNAVETIIVCPIDGYIALNLWFNRDKWVYGIEFGSNDYFLRSEYLLKLASLKRTFNNNTPEYKTLSILLGSDPHAEIATFERFMAFGARYSDYFDDIVVNGDVVAAKFGAAGNEMPFDNIPGFDKVLLSIGNHDCYDWNNLAPAGQEYSRQYEANNAQKYARYMKNIALWGVVGAGVDKCYYYKDYDTESAVEIAGAYARKVRLIVLDSMDDSADQTTWLVNVLADALANNRHVVCMSHIINNPVSTVVPMDCNWSEDMMWGAQSRGHEEWLAAVQDYIDDGGVFVCWIHGHTHCYNIGTFAEYPKQMYINLGATFQNPAWGHRETVRLDNDASFDNFCVFSVDPLRRHVKLMKVGCNYDRDLKHRGTIAFKYGDVPSMISQF